VKVPLSTNSSQFVYKPTRRRFLHAALSIPIAAGLIPSFTSPAQAETGTDNVPPHQLKFITPGGHDPRTKVILIFMQGGLSFFDTFDPKTASKIRGPFNPISTAAKGVQITEPLNPLAKHMNKFLIVNNLHTNISDHDRGASIVYTASPRVEGSAFYAPTTYTNPFIEFSRILTQQASRDIGYVVLHQSTTDINSNLFGQNEREGRSWSQPWGALKHNDPETIYSSYDTNTGIFTNPFRGGNLPIDTFRERMKLLEMLKSRGHTLVGDSVDRYDKSHHKAASLIDGDFNQSFDLGSESQELLLKYGDSKIGKQLLLGRRMLDRGARVIVANDGNYDSHNLIEKNMRLMIPNFAQALSALLDDIEHMNEKVYVVITTEFGRTPVITASKGRDHWPQAFGIIIAGNDIKEGRVIGKTNDDGIIVGDTFDASMTGETILNLMGLGRFEMRGDVVTSKRFPFIDLNTERVVS